MSTLTMCCVVPVYFYLATPLPNSFFDHCDSCFSRLIITIQMLRQILKGIAEIGHFITPGDALLIYLLVTLVQIFQFVVEKFHVPFAKGELSGYIAHFCFP